MGSVMIDRWSVENVIEYLEGDVEKYKDISAYDTNHFSLTFLRAERKDNYERNSKAFIKCWDNFLTALILWDEIWSFNRKFIYDWKQSLGSEYLTNNLEKIIHQVEPNMISDSLTSIYEMLKIDGEDYNSLIHQTWERTFGYQLISSSLGVPFLAHPSRYQDIITEGISSRLFSRLDVIDRIDKELKKYYKYINTELGREFLKFEYPVLIDLIKKEAHTPEEELRMALEMRVESDVVIFREQIFAIEQIINQGNTQALLTELKLVSDLAKDITAKYAKKIHLGEFSISINPSFTIPINLRKNEKNVLHATFIKRLLNHGVYARYDNYNEM